MIDEYDYAWSQASLKEIPILAPLSKKQEVYLNDKEHDIVCWGGAASSGKSYISALDILVNGYSDKDYRAGIVRKQKEQLKGAGSLFDECVQMYSQFGVKPRGNSMDFSFASGALVKMTHSDKPADKHNFQGWQCTSFLVDEAQQLNEENIVYLLSRLRSKSKKAHQLKLTCNPDYSSFLRVWLEMAGYLGEDGVPCKERDGKTTYYAEVAGEVVFCQSMEEFNEKYEGMDVDPLKFVFYAANCYDNPWIVKHLPKYVNKLKNLPRLERQRLFEGSWYAKETSSGHFKREWCTLIEKGEIPLKARRARTWDKAATLPSEANKDPDWTVGVKGCLDELGNLFVMDMVRFRNRPAIVQQTIEATGLKDGSHCVIGIPQDVGGAAIEAMQFSKAALMKKGLNVIVCKANKSKAIRFEPVAIAAQNRSIYIVKGDWNKAFFDELEQLDFDDKHSHDDIADALSDLYSVLAKRMMMPTIEVNKERSMTRDTRL